MGTQSMPPGPGVSLNDFHARLTRVARPMALLLLLVGLPLTVPPLHAQSPLTIQPSTGRVGIGTTTPSDKLEVVGNLRLNGTAGGIRASGGTNVGVDLNFDFPDLSTAGGNFRMYRNTNTTGSKTFTIFKGDGTGTSQHRFSATGDTYLNLAGGNVGIGTETPNARLEVAGNLRLTGTSQAVTASGGANVGVDLNFDFPDLSTAGGNFRMYRNTNTTGTKTFTIFKGDGTGTSQHRFSATGDTYLNLAGGNVGIGTTAPGYKLDIAGGARNTTGVWADLSDAQLKKDVAPLADALATVSGLSPVTFRWTDPQKDQEYGTVRGFVAQDVEKVLPEWVKTDANGLKTLEPIGIHALLVQAIKELKAENEALKARLSALETQSKSGL